jgi:hypothetical protein
MLIVSAEIIKALPLEVSLTLRTTSASSLSNEPGGLLYQVVER